MGNLVDTTLLKHYDDNLKDVARLLRRSCNYNIGDKVSWKGVYLECTTAGKTGTVTPNLVGLNVGDTVNDNTVAWKVITFGGGSSSGTTIKSWASNTAYKVDDMVIYANDFYQCITAHTSSTTFSSDRANWVEISATRVFDWVSANSYVEGNLVMYDISANLQNWVSGTTYSVSDKIIYDSLVYECLVANSDTTFTIANWKKIGMVGKAPYRCITANNDTNFDSAKWEAFYDVNGSKSSSGLVSLYTGTSQIISITGSVQYGLSDNPRNYDFVCFVFESVGVYDNITETTFTTGSAQMLSFGSDSQGIGRNSSDAYGGWVKMTSTDVTVGLRTKGSDVISVCLKDVLAWNIGSSGSGGGSSSGATIADWATGKAYKVDDIVIYQSRVYKCTTAHTSTTFSADIANWTPLSTDIPQWQPNIDYFVGDVVQYNSTFYTCTNTHTSGTAFSTSDFDNLIDSSKGMTMDTLWAGTIGNLNGTSTDTITLSSSGTAYKKLGLFYDYWNGSRSCSGYTEVSVGALSNSFCYAPALKEINGYNPNFDKMQLTTDTTLYFESYYIQMTKVVGLVEGEYIPSTLEAVKVDLWTGSLYTSGASVALADDYLNYDLIMVTLSDTAGYAADVTVFDPQKNHYCYCEYSTAMANANLHWANVEFATALGVSSTIATLHSGYNLNTGWHISAIQGIKFIEPNSYSTQEKLIGTWVDGKPLYRKVLLSPTTGSQFGLSNISVKRLTGVVHDTASPQFVFEMPYADGSYSVACNYDTSTDTVTINCTPATWSVTPEYIFIDYTKN